MYKSKKLSSPFVRVANLSNDDSARMSMEIDTNHYVREEIDGRIQYRERGTSKVLSEIEYADLRDSWILIQCEFPQTLLNPNHREFHDFLSSQCKATIAKQKSAISDLSPMSAIQFCGENKIEDFEAVVICVDLQGSTLLSIELSDGIYERIMNAYLLVLRSWAGFYGLLEINHTGDGLILCLPINYKSSLANRESLDIIAAKIIHFSLLVEYTINVSLSSMVENLGLPEIKCRIGVDAGWLRYQSESQTIIGSTISVASKLQSSADESSIIFGEDVMPLYEGAQQKYFIGLTKLKQKIMRDQAKVQYNAFGCIGLLPENKADWLV